jgi:hypothetical protein
MGVPIARASVYTIAAGEGTRLRPGDAALARKPGSPADLAPAIHE